MADWTYVPTYVHRLQHRAPKALVKRFDDGSTSRRRKSSAGYRIWTESYVMDSTDIAAAETFFTTKGNDIAFTKVTYDAGEAPATEASVYFLSEFFDTQQTSPSQWNVLLRFEEVV